MTETDLTRDHVPLTDTFVARRYFRKFEAITAHLPRVASTMVDERRLRREEVDVLARYIGALTLTFRALSTKYLFAGREGLTAPTMNFDAHESGFPVFGELLTMANDAQQAERHLKNMASVEAFKDEMVRQIVGELTIPTRLQFALSQRMYYEILQDAALFWAHNDPEAVWLGQVGGDRQAYMLHWAVYDSQINLPVVYLMEVEDTGRYALPRDGGRWAEVQRHLMAQSIGGLKLLTIAQGFDKDFDDLHPKRLKRFHIGPMYSSAYTWQSGPIHDVLDEAKSPEGEDWALAWTVEELESERIEFEKSGWFGQVERQIFALDPFSGQGAETGATRTERSVILPERVFQTLAHKNPPGFRLVRKFVVGAGGRVLSYA